VGRRRRRDREEEEGGERKDLPDNLRNPEIGRQ